MAFLRRLAILWRYAPPAHHVHIAEQPGKLVKQSAQSDHHRLAGIANHPATRPGAAIRIQRNAWRGVRPPRGPENREGGRNAGLWRGGATRQGASQLSERRGPEPMRGADGIWASSSVQRARTSRQGRRPHPAGIGDAGSAAGRPATPRAGMSSCPALVSPAPRALSSGAGRLA